MPRFEEASELVSIGPDVFGRETQLTPDAAKAWFAMRDASTDTDLKIQVISGFRSISRQKEILERKIRRGESLEWVLHVSAYPGYSEHHTGKALDLGSPCAEHLTEAFDSTPEFSWLVENSEKFGFLLSYPKGNEQGIVYEPWHWFYRGCRA